MRLQLASRLRFELSDREMYHDHWSDNLRAIHCRCCCREYVRKQIPEKGRDRRRYYLNPYRCENSVRASGNSCIITDTYNR